MSCAEPAALLEWISCIKGAFVALHLVLVVPCSQKMIILIINEHSNFQIGKLLLSVFSVLLKLHQLGMFAPYDLQENTPIYRHHQNCLLLASRELHTKIIGGKPIVTIWQSDHDWSYQTLELASVSTLYIPPVRKLYYSGMHEQKFCARPQVTHYVLVHNAITDDVPSTKASYCLDQLNFFSNVT